MEKEVKPWVVFAPLQDNCTEHEIIQNLFNTITESGCISDKKLFEKDMNDKILNRNADINELLKIYHTPTKGVKHICASITAEKNGKTYAMIAYTGPNDFCLKRLALLLEGLIAFTSSGYRRLHPQADSKGPELSDIFSPAFLQEKGISFYDYEDFFYEGLIK